MNKPRFVSLRRVSAMVLSAFILVSLAACNQTSSVSSAGSDAGSASSSEEATYFNKTGYPICDEPITITVTGNQAGTPDWNDTYQVAEIEKRFGIKLECTPYAKDAWESQYTLMLTTDTLPDLILNGYVQYADAAKYGGEGYFIALNDYLDYAPNLVKLFEEDPDYKACLTAFDGNIYGLATYSKNIYNDVTRVYMSQKWLDNVGLDAPTNLDELYNVLKAFKEQDANGNGDKNDEIPFGYSDTYSRAQLAIMSGFGIQASRFYPEYILTVSDNGTVGLAETTENYKAFLKYMHKLYDEGLMDEVAFVQSTDEFKEKFAADRIGFYGAGGAPFADAGKSIDYDMNYTVIMGLTSEYNSEKLVPKYNAVGKSMYGLISSKTEYPEAIVRLLDYFFTDEGSVAGMRGFEGVTFDYEEVEGIPGSKVATLYQPDGYASQEEFRTQKGVINGGFQFISPIAGTQYAVIRAATDEQLENILLSQYGWAVLLEQRLREEGMKTVPVFPNLVYTEEESSTRSTLFTDISTYLKTVKAQFITGEVDIDSGWDTFISTLDQMGLKEILAIEQAAYDRYNK